MLTNFISHSKCKPIGASHESQTRSFQLYPINKNEAVAPEIPLQGLSGLVFLKEDNDRIYFSSLTDRGPNHDVITHNGKVSRPFLNPKFQPRIYQFSVPKRDGTVRIEQTIQLTSFDGTPLSGLPPCDRSMAEEMPITQDGTGLTCDAKGIDPESIAIDSNGNFWIGEEYRPSILQFSPKGQLIKAYIPGGMHWSGKGSLNKNVLPILPSNFIHRLPNRGFEALTIKDDKLFAMLQSPIRNPLTAQLQAKIEIIKIDLSHDNIIASYWYPMSTPTVDKIGDMTAEDENHLLILEQNSLIGAKSVHQIFKVSLESKNSITTRSPNTVLQKSLVLDLVKSGYDQFEKVEGLTILPNSQLAVVNDNDFGVGKNTPAQSELALFSVNRTHQPTPTKNK